MQLFDTHCHLTDGAFDGGEREAAVERARTAGVVGIVTVSSDADDAGACSEFAARHRDVWCTAGIHPHVAASSTRDARDRIADLACGRRVVAIGETGLDYHYDNSPRADQRRSFSWQVGLAEELALPVVVHSRAAEADTIAAVRGAGGVRGVLHCFSGGAALLEAGLEADWFISFSGMITFKRYDAELLRAVPLDRLLLETDAPYLAPEPKRGRRNEPALIEHTCRHAAALLELDPDELARRTTANAAAFYRIEIPDPGVVDDAAADGVPGRPEAH